MFNRICGIYERGLLHIGDPEQLYWLNKCKLFKIEESSSQAIVQKASKLEDTDLLFPYDEVAFDFSVIAGDLKVKTNNSVVFLIDEDKSLGIILSEYENPYKGGDYETIMSVGDVNPKTLDFNYEGFMELTSKYDGYVIKNQERVNQCESYLTDILRYVGNIIKCISAPRNFILRSRSNRPYKTGKKIQRDNNRDIYRILNLNELQNRYSLGNETGQGTKCPHPRRAHKRRLPTGKITNVRASWIGPEEITDKRYTHRVILNPGD